MTNYLVTVDNFETKRFENKIIMAHNEAEARAIILIGYPYCTIKWVEEFTPEVAKEKYNEQFERGVRRRLFFEENVEEIGEW